MNTSEETYHLINSYIAGSLKGRDLDKFKTRLREKPELQQAYALQKEIIAALEEKREAELKALITNGVKNKQPIAMWNKKVQFALATAASIALIAAVVIFWPKQDGQTELANDTEHTEESLDTVIEDASNITRDNLLEPRPIDTQTLAIAETQKELITPEPTIEIAEDTEVLDDLTEEEIIEQDYESPQKDSSNTGENDIAVSTTSSTEVSKSLEKPKILEKKSAVEKDEASEIEEVVLKDEIIGSQYYTVASVSLSYADFENSSEALKRSRSDLEKQVLEAEDDSPTEANAKATKSLKVEFWKSVVNFKGYKYNSRVIQLYGISISEAITLKELDNRLYIKIDDKFYFLEKSKNHKRLIEVTNATLLNVLQNE